MRITLPAKMVIEVDMAMNMSRLWQLIPDGPMNM